MTFVPGFFSTGDKSYGLLSTPLPREPGFSPGGARNPPPAPSFLGGFPLAPRPKTPGGGKEAVTNVTGGKKAR